MWSEAEIRVLGKLHGLSPQVVEERFGAFGGVARTIVDRTKPTSTLSQLMQQCTPDAVIQIMAVWGNLRGTLTQTDSEATTLHHGINTQLLALIPVYSVLKSPDDEEYDSAPTTFSVRWISPSLTVPALKLINDAKKMNDFTRMVNVTLTGSEAGEDFERFAHRVIRMEFRSKIRPLGSYKNKIKDPASHEENIALGEPRHLVAFANLDGVDFSLADAYFAPVSRNFAGIDAFSVFPLSLFPEPDEDAGTGVATSSTSRRATHSSAKRPRMEAAEAASGGDGGVSSSSSSSSSLNVQGPSAELKPDQRRAFVAFQMTIANRHPVKAVELEAVSGGEEKRKDLVSSSLSWTSLSRSNRHSLCTRPSARAC